MVQCARESQQFDSRLIPDEINPEFLTVDPNPKPVDNTE
jgi:hypothetical protein